MDDVELVRSNGLFDAAYYIQQLDVQLPPVTDPALHYLETGWIEGYDPGPLFSTKGYLQRYPDVAASAMNPLVHYLRYGMRDGRQGWNEQDLLAWQRPLIASAQESLSELKRHDFSWPRLSRGDVIHVHAHSKGHIVFRDFQRLLIEAFCSAGVRAEEGDERNSASRDLRIVIAPHDFFFLEGAPSRDGFDFRNCVLLNSEQMQSIWFARSYRLLTQAPYVLDINLQTAASLARLGLPARFLPLGRVTDNPIFRQPIALPSELEGSGLPNAPKAVDAGLESRGLDIVWIGSNSKRRQAFYDEHAALFESPNNFVRLVNVRGALKAGHRDAISAQGYAALGQRAKIVLNVHHFSSPYFEWQRLMHFGLMQGACVVTETASRIPHMMPGEHYLETEITSMKAFLDWLLRDPEGRELLQTVRLNGYRAAIKNFDLARSLRQIFSISADAA